MPPRPGVIHEIPMEEATPAVRWLNYYMNIAAYSLATKRQGVDRYQLPGAWRLVGRGREGRVTQYMHRLTSVLFSRNVANLFCDLDGISAAEFYRRRRAGRVGVAGVPRHRGQISDVTSVIVRNSATPRHGNAKQSPSPTSRGSRRRREALHSAGDCPIDCAGWDQINYKEIIRRARLPWQCTRQHLTI